MLTGSERHALIILGCVILILAAVHIGVTILIPHGGAIEYSEDVPDGARVMHTGIIEELKFTKTGGHLIINLSGTDVFVPGGGSSPTLLRGDRVTVTGIAETYAGKREIVVNDISDVKLI